MGLFGKKDRDTELEEYEKIYLQRLKVNEIIPETESPNVQVDDYSESDETVFEDKSSKFSSFVVINNNQYEGKNLESQDFQNKNFENYSFAKSNLKNSNFSNSKLKKCDFTDSDLTDANFTNCDLRGSRFFRANTKNTKFANAILFEKNSAEISLKQILDSDLRKMQLTRIILRNNDLTGKNFEGANLSNSKMSGCIFSEVNFSLCDLREAEMFNSNFKNSNLTEANLENADLSYADISGANLSYAKIKGANFKNAIMIGTILDGIDQSIANFSGVRYEPPMFSEKQLKKKAIMDSIELVTNECYIVLTPEKFQLSSESISNYDMVIRSEALAGQGDFARLISGGNFDFITGNCPQYDIGIKFHKMDPKMSDLWVKILRQSFPKKFEIIQNDLSIGAYWITDMVNQEFATTIIRQLLKQFTDEIFSNL